MDQTTPQAKAPTLRLRNLYLVVSIATIIIHLTVMALGGSFGHVLVVLMFVVPVIGIGWFMRYGRSQAQ